MSFSLVFIVFWVGFIIFMVVFNVFHHFSLILSMCFPLFSFFDVSTCSSSIFICFEYVLIIRHCVCNVFLLCLTIFHWCSLLLHSFSCVFHMFLMCLMIFHCFFNVFSCVSLLFMDFHCLFHYLSLFFPCSWMCNPSKWVQNLNEPQSALEHSSKQHYTGLNFHSMAQRIFRFLVKFTQIGHTCFFLVVFSETLKFFQNQFKSRFMYKSRLAVSNNFNGDSK